MDNTAVNEIHDYAIQLARHAGKIIKGAHEKAKNIKFKASPADLMTETDVEVEKFVKEKVRERYPSHRFVGEESAFDVNECLTLTDEVTWMVDPIDGTCNFVHKFPHFCISIGIAIKTQLVIGVIYNPILDNLYTAKSGGGAFLNGVPIKVTDTTELKKALIITEFGSGRDEGEMTVKVANVGKLIMQCHGIRCLGSAALNMSAVASGQADAYIEHGLHCWDMAAAAVIIREAGGCVINPDGSEFDVMGRQVLCAGTRELCDQIQPHLNHPIIKSH